MLFLMFSSDVFPELSMVTTKGLESSVVVFMCFFQFCVSLYDKHSNPVINCFF